MSPGSASDAASLSELQLDIMRVLWTRGACTTTEVTEALRAERNLAHTTVSTLLTRLEKQGLSFASDEDREAELKRLAELSDEAFAATEAAYERLPKSAKADKDKEEKPADSDQGGKPAAKASTETPLRSDAGVRPHDVDDRKVSLEDRLRDGFMAAYRNRVGEDSPEHSQINA